MKDQFLLNYQDSWSGKFKLEARRISAVLGEVVKDIEHIGSTSIPGMMAKPIIDMAVLVDSIEDISFFVEKLAASQYQYAPDLSSSERIFLRKGDPIEYHLSITCLKHDFWDRNIIFRDYLKTHSELIKEYTQLKLNNIATTSEMDFKDLSRSQAYNSGKGEFVKKVLDLARAKRELNALT